MSSKPNLWFVIKHRATGELSIVNSLVREHQLQLWAVNCMVVPSYVIKEFKELEEAGNFMVEMNAISEMLNNILKKDG